MSKKACYIDNESSPSDEEYNSEEDDPCDSTRQSTPPKKKNDYNEMINQMTEKQKEMLEMTPLEKEYDEKQIEELSRKRRKE